jgi:murein DD-endopeptidase MepM/ murein hydrolase activator NlpD
MNLNPHFVAVLRGVVPLFIITQGAVAATEGDKAAEGIKVNFVIDDNHLIQYTIARRPYTRCSKTHRDSIAAFKKLARKKSAKCCAILSGRCRPEYLTEESIAGFSKDLPGFFPFLKKSKEYAKILTETRERLDFCKKQWDKNYSRSLKIVKELTGLELSDESYVVYVTHPAIPAGRYLGNNKISWGGKEKWDNYTTVYLWHEILHSYFGRSDLDHALVQFMTDSELRKKLNGDAYPPFVGHKYLHPLMDKILPHWKEYLKSPDKDMWQFREKLVNLGIGQGRDHSDNTPIPKISAAVPSPVSQTADGFDFPVRKYFPVKFGFLQRIVRKIGCPLHYFPAEGIGGSPNTEIYAAANGVVTFAGFETIYGGYVIVMEHTAPPGNKFKLPDGGEIEKVWTAYTHLSKIDEANVTPGKAVRRGSRIGFMGDFPHGSGKNYYLHFEVRKQNLWEAGSYIYSNPNRVCKKPKKWVADRFACPSKFIRLNLPMDTPKT